MGKLRHLGFIAGLSLLALEGVGCRRASKTESASPSTAPTTAASVKVAAGSGRRSEEVKPKERIDIPAGRFFAGSLPGDEGRDPTLEPVAASFELPGFAIDALPYPGTPGTAPLTGVSQIEAAKLCGERGARLCTELEWERACRGPMGDLFSAGAAWDPTCSGTPEKCVSGFGVRSMGASIEEWTSSAVETPKDHNGPKPTQRFAVKGSYSHAAPSAHRFAARHALEPYSAAGKPVGFRCCAGGASQGQGPTIAAIESQPTFRRAAIEISRIADIFAAIPELARVKAGAHLFKDTEIATVTEHAHPSGAAPRTSTDGFVLTVEPVLWSPVPGTEILVLAGKSKGSSWVVALHRLPDSRFRLASSMIFANEPGPIVLAYQGNIKKEITWSMCWGCAGEFGAVTYRDDHRVVIVQR